MRVWRHNFIDLSPVPAHTCHPNHQMTSNIATNSGGFEDRSVAAHGDLQIPMGENPKFLQSAVKKFFDFLFYEQW